MARFLLNDDKQSKIVNYSSYAVYSIVALIGMVVNWMVLDKCFVMADDAWYLCLLRDLPHGLNSTGFLLFGNIFNDNIYAIRCACYILNVISGLVFAIGLFCYADERNFFVGQSKKRRFCNVLLWLFVVFAGQLRIVTCPSFNYITLNQIIMQLSLGLLLVSVSRRSMLAMFFSGFFVAVLVPVMITNIIAVPFILLFAAAYIYVAFGGKDFLRDLMKFILVYMLGIVVFLAIYFIFVEDIKTYFDALLNNMNETIARGETDYGIKFLYKWLHRTMVFYFMQVVMVALALHYIPALVSRMKLSGKFAFIFRVMAYLAVFAYIRAAVNYDAMFFVMVLAFYLFLDDRNVADRKAQLIFMLLLLMPVCLSFGLNNSFHDRGYEYMAFVVPLMCFCAVKWWHKVLSSGVLVVYAVELCMSLYAPTWHGDIYAEQKYDLRELGIDQKIFVDKCTYARIETMKPYLHRGDTVWCDTESWGFVELLELVPISYEYRISHDLVDSVKYVFVRDDFRYADVVSRLEASDAYDEVSYGRFSLYIRKTRVRDKKKLQN